MSKHSDKALKTFELMGSKPEDWKTAEIEWREELCEVPTKIECPYCRGRGRCWYRHTTYIAYEFGLSSLSEFEIWCEANNTTVHSFTAYQKYAEAYGLKLLRCKKCPAKRGWVGETYGTGQITTLIKRKVWIGYIIWLPSTLFLSRFRDNGCDVCELCAKVIKKSNLYPVQGKDEKGTPLGMWVGQDCARKFIAGAQRWKRDYFLKDNL